jgi:hypothetical protein
MPSSYTVTFVQINNKPSPFVIVVADTQLALLDLSVESTSTPEITAEDFMPFDPKSQNLQFAIKTADEKEFTDATSTASYGTTQI